VQFRRTRTASDLAAVRARSPLGAAGSIIGFALVSASILKTWWDSRLGFVSGMVYLIALNISYILLKGRARRQRISP
jgi:hypothetical protein